MLQFILVTPPGLKNLHKVRANNLGLAFNHLNPKGTFFYLTAVVGIVVGVAANEFDGICGLVCNPQIVDGHPLKI